MIAPSPVVDSAAAAVTAAVAATAGVSISLACFQQATVPSCRPPLATDFPAFFFYFFALHVRVMGVLSLACWITVHGDGLVSPREFSDALRMLAWNRREAERLDFAFYLFR